MRAIIDATGYRPELKPFIKYRPSPMFKILDQPLIFHVIEYLAKHGIQEIHLVLSHLPYQIENFCEDGRRWGAHIEHHLVQEPMRPYHMMKIIADEWDNHPFLLGKGDILPFIDTRSLIEVHKKEGLQQFLYFSKNRWSGWAIGNQTMLVDATREMTENEFLASAMERDHRLHYVNRFLETSNLEELISTNLAILKDMERHHLIPFTSKSLCEGFWVSRGVKIHKSAEIIPPVFIGEYCQIQENTKIGPNVVIEKNCVVENQTNVENSLILQQSYLGEGLHVDECIIDRHYLYSFKHKSRVIMNDDMIISELSHPPSPKKVITHFIERIFALLLLIVLSPVLVVGLLFRRIKKTEVISIPTGIDKNLWKTYHLYTLPPKNDPDNQGFLSFIPLIFNILKGDLHFVGTEPRTFREVYLMPPEWRSIYLKSKTGLISIVDVDLDENPTSYEKFSAEAFYTANMSAFLDISLMIRWLGKKISSLFKPGL